MARDDPAKKRDWVRRALAEFEGPLLRYAARLTGDDELAQDVVQETFLRLCAEDPSKVQDRLAPWLFKVCRSRAIDVRRKERKTMRLENGQTLECESTEPDPAAAFEQRDAAGRMLEMLDTLPQNQHEVLHLKFQQGLSYREISDITNHSVSHVGVLIHTAIKTLRERMRTDAALPPKV
jgi:RNA polymerase sigma factor (sigma-70 family)